LSEVFSGIEDPRIDRNKKYPLNEIIFLVLVGAIAGVESWRGLELVGNEKLAFLRKYLPYVHGICSHQTISRVFSLLSPKIFETVVRKIFSKIFPGCENDIIALDGKTLKGSANKARGIPALHLLNAWSVRNGISLAQLEVDSKTNEISAVPEIIDMLDVKGATVTVDALNCQKEIAEKLITAGADYVLALKGNHQQLHETVISKFEEELPAEGKGTFFQVTEKGHGRVETRTYYSAEAGDWIPSRTDWKGLKSIGIAMSDVHRQGTDSSQIRFFLCSFAPDAERLAEAVRGHWGVENGLHWVLDVVFKEDGSQKRTDHAPKNFSLIRKMVTRQISTSCESNSRLFIMSS
jgi:predicted transposase YbfD/YdcC